MSKTRLVTNAVRTMTRFKLRTSVMMLGSLVGVAALTLVISIGTGAERKILATVRQLFGDTSILVLARGSQLMGGPRPDAARLTLDDLDAVAREVPDIDTWDPQQVIPAAAVRRAGATATVRVLGVSERSERVWSRSVTRGGYFGQAEVRGFARVALVGETAARSLFGNQNPLNEEIQVGSVSLRVIGILEPLGTDVHGMDRDNEIVVPISTAMRRLMNVDTIAMAKVLVRDPARSEETARDITRVLRERHHLTRDQQDDFTLLTPAEVRRTVDRFRRVLALYLPLVAGIALVVGALVAATLMLASVNARTAEIGIRRAVGATEADIQLQFLAETAATMLIGGLVGIAIGYAGALAAASRMQLGPVFSWKAILVGLAVSLAAGFVAGLVPARRAARQHPADALR